MDILPIGTLIEQRGEAGYNTGQQKRQFKIVGVNDNNYIIKPQATSDEKTYSKKSSTYKKKLEEHLEQTELPKHRIGPAYLVVEKGGSKYRRKTKKNKKSKH